MKEKRKKKVIFRKVRGRVIPIRVQAGAEGFQKGALAGGVVGAGLLGLASRGPRKLPGIDYVQSFFKISAIGGVTGAAIGAAAGGKPKSGGSKVDNISRSFVRNAALTAASGSLIVGNFLLKNRTARLYARGLGNIGVYAGSVLPYVEAARAEKDQRAAALAASGLGWVAGMKSSVRIIGTKLGRRRFRGRF